MPIVKTTITYYEKAFVKADNSQPSISQLQAQAKKDALNKLGDYNQGYEESFFKQENGNKVVVKCYLKFDYELI